MKTTLFHMGPVAALDDAQRAMAEEFINSQSYASVATNNSKTGARLSYLGNIPGQTLDVMYFATDAQSAKIANIEATGRMEFGFTNSMDQLFLSGEARIIKDRETRHAKWADWMIQFFNDGVDGKGYTLVEFRPKEARIMMEKYEAVFEPVMMEPIYIVGISVRTSNATQPVTNDIANLWARFWSEGVLQRIPGKASDELYAVYTEYEGDAFQPYTMVIGCRVTSMDNIPEGMKGVAIAGGNYVKTGVNGKLSQGVMQEGWMAVWQSKLDRSYQADFELYKCDGTDPDHVDADIYVGIKS